MTSSENTSFFTQEYLEKNSRWFSHSGFLVSDSIIASKFGKDGMSEEALFGAYVYHFDKPSPCVFVSFGAGGTWIPNFPAARQFTISTSNAEQDRITDFIWYIDADGKYSIRARQYHIDLHECTCVRRPSDEEIANMHLRYNEELANKKLPSSGGPKKITASTTISSVMRGLKRQRRKRNSPLKNPPDVTTELRALDRRRLHDCDLQPPEERSNIPHWMESIRTTSSYSKEEMDEDDEDDEESSPTKKRKKTGASSSGGILERVLKSMQPRRRSLHQPK